MDDRPSDCCAWCHAAQWEGFQVRCLIDFGLRDPGTERCQWGMDPLDPRQKRHAKTANVAE